MLRDSTFDLGTEITVSFGYQCDETRIGQEIPSKTKLQRMNRAFSCLFCAAMGANSTWCNTKICNGLFEAEILPALDSAKSFRRIPSSSSFPKLDLLSSSLQSSYALSSSIQSGLSNLSCSPSSDSPDCDSFSLKSSSAPSMSEGFLNAVELQVAGGAAGEDRVQAFCSEENGWLFCAIYDGFNGRDAADFLAGTLYETIRYHLNSLDCEVKSPQSSDHLGSEGSRIDGKQRKNDLYKNRVLDCLQRAIEQADIDFLFMVEQEMEHRPEMVAAGSCVLVVVLHGMDLYVLNLGDSRAVLATEDEEGDDKGLKALKLTDCHTALDETERIRLLQDHPDDPATILGDRVKGKVKVTRAVGVGYLKKSHLNDALVGILRAQNLQSPPYISVEPSLIVREISTSDRFVVLGSDGLFDFFSSNEVVFLVDSYASTNPCGDPAKYLIEQVVLRAANSAGFSREELMRVPAGLRRDYHDDVTVIVIVLGTHKRTSKASAWL